MNREISKLWTDKLRSGKISQCSGWLGKSDGSRCCLGVLCDLYVDAHPGTPLAPGDNYPIPDDPNRAMTYGTVAAALPGKVMEWAGMRTADGRLTRTHIGDMRYASLAAANDSGSSFKEIADLIDENKDSL